MSIHPSIVTEFVWVLNLWGCFSCMFFFGFLIVLKPWAFEKLPPGWSFSETLDGTFFSLFYVRLCAMLLFVGFWLANISVWLWLYCSMLLIVLDISLAFSYRWEIFKAKMEKIPAWKKYLYTHGRNPRFLFWTVTLSFWFSYSSPSSIPCFFSVVSLCLKFCLKLCLVASLIP